MAEADPGVLAGLAAVPEVAVADTAALDAQLRAATAPFVVRGLGADWPLVEDRIARSWELAAPAARLEAGGR